MCTLIGTATCLLDNVDTKMQMRNVMKHVLRQAPCHRGVQTFSKIAISPGSSQGNLIYQKQNTNSHANTVCIYAVHTHIYQYVAGKAIQMFDPLFHFLLFASLR